MNRVTAPSFARASSTNFATSPVRSTKPRPAVWTARSEETIVFVLIVDGAERNIDLGEVMEDLSTCRSGERRDRARPPDPGRRWLYLLRQPAPVAMAAFGGTTIIKSCRRHPSASGWPFP